jgi:hypothetical protein
MNHTVNFFYKKNTFCFIHKIFYVRLQIKSGEEAT